MKPEAKLILEYVVQKLDEATGHTPNYGSWKVQVEHLRPENEDTLTQSIFYIEGIMADLMAVNDGVGKVLAGDNILTPSLTNKGWKFWKKPILTEDEKQAIGSAYIKYNQLISLQSKSLLRALKKSPSADDHSYLIAKASQLDILYTCMQQLSTDLKQILVSEKS